MTEQTTESQPKGIKGKLSLIIILAITIIGGAVTLFLLFQTSDKQTYFKAEQASYDFLKEQAEDRFENELAWAEATEKNPTEAIVDISAEYNDPYAFGGVSEMEEIVNNSSLTIKSQADMKGKKIFADIEADAMGMKFDGIRMALSDTTLLLELPFLKDVLQIESEDLSELLYEIDPYSFEEGVEYDFSNAFNSEDYPIPKEDREYLADKYGKFIYDVLPDDAFSSDKEEVKVDGESIKAEKLTFQLTEEEVQTVVTNLIEEIEADDRLKDILEAYMEDNFLPADELEMLMDDFEESLAEMKEDVDKIVLPEGIESTVWTKSGLIVKRHFAITTEDFYGDEVTFEIDGTQLLEDKQQKLNYTFNVKDEYMDESFDLTADLSKDGDKIKDTITLGIEDDKVIYEGEETLKGSDREFTRTLSVESMFLAGSIVWTGDSKYEKDQMSSNHNFHVEAEGFDEDMLSVQIGVEGKKLKEIESINTDNVKDIGKMSEAEIMEYIDGEAAEQFFEWYMETFGAAGF